MVKPTQGEKEILVGLLRPHADEFTPSHVIEGTVEEMWPAIIEKLKRNEVGYRTGGV